MRYELRPLSLAEILDAGFRLVQTEWKTLIGLAAIMQIPLVVIAGLAPALFDPLANEFAPAEGASPEALAQMMVGFGSIGVVYLFLYPFIAVAVTASVANFYLGRSFTLSDAARVGLRSMFRLMGSYFVWLIAYVGVMVAVVAVAVMAFSAGGALLGGFLEAIGTIGTVTGVLLGTAVGMVAIYWILFATVVSSLLPAVTVLESRGIFRTAERAFSLGATSKGRLIGVIFTTGMIVGFPVVGAQMLIGVIPVFGLLVWAIFQAIGFAFSTAVTVVLYFDLRCRAENYDLELLAEQVEAGPGFGHG